MCDEILTFRIETIFKTIKQFKNKLKTLKQIKKSAPLDLGRWTYGIGSLTMDFYCETFYNGFVL